MSKARGLFPMAIATVIGIGTGIAIFDPAFKEEKEQKDQQGYMHSTSDLLTTYSHIDSRIGFKEQHSTSPEEQIHAKEVAVANAGGATTIPKDAARWGEVQAN